MRCAGLIPWIALISCAPAAPETARIGAARQPIIGGTTSGADHDGAVLLVFEGPRGDTVFTCTAALLAPNLVATARHCVSEVEDPNVACDGDGTQVSGIPVGQDRPAARFGVHVGAARPAPGTAADAHGKKIIHDEATTLCGHDIAYIILDTELTSAPMFPVRLGAPPKANESLIVLGYGVSETEAEPPVRRERRGVIVRAIGPFDGSETDPPVAPGDFLTAESFCQGDSGGPALSESSGAIVGIMTRVTNRNTAPDKPWDACEESPAHPRAFAYYTQLSASESLARSAYALAGHLPWIEGKRDPRLPHLKDDSCSVRAAGRVPADRASVFAAALAALALARSSRRQSTGTARGRSPARTDKRC
jgi:hypothetical protein